MEPLLASAGGIVDPEDLVVAATAKITWLLARTVARDPSIQPAGDPLAVDLVLALRGSEDARLRLPSELLDLVRLEPDLANVT